MKLIIFSFILIIFISNKTIGQGCSDAGACTINSFKPNSIDTLENLKNKIKIGSFIGKADQNISIYGTYLEYSKLISDKLDLDFKLTSLSQNGNNISKYDLSDIYLNSKYKLSDEINLSLSFKFPLNSANKIYENLPLPMDYQSSLGTYDLIFGISYKLNNFQFVFAFQEPLSQNKNQFLNTNHNDNSTLFTFQSTKQFKRSADFLIRVSYPIMINSKLSITPSILPIFHIANDKYLNEMNIEKEILGSKGLTLNCNIYLDYLINNYNKIQVNFGLPFLVREKRPDGLTRSFIFNLEYSYLF